MCFVVIHIIYDFLTNIKRKLYFSYFFREGVWILENTKKETIEIMHQQLKLLSEKSKEKEITPEQLKSISGEMDRIANTILNANVH